MKSLRIVADDKIPFLKGIFESCDISMRYLSGSKICAQDLADADALITRTRTRCDEALLVNSKVKYIATATIGFDHIDQDYLAQKNIAWSNAVGCNSSSVMQYIASVLSQLNPQGKTLGIIGVGNVGRKVAHMAKVLGMNLLLNDPPRALVEGKHNFVDLPELIANSDIITIHAPLNSDTYHLVDKDFLSAMKPTAWLINSARGEICSSIDFKNALKKNSIAGGILDVWENEPNIDLELLELLKFGTPHIAGYSTDGKANGTAQSVRSIANFFDIEPLKKFKVSNLPKPMNAKLEIGNLSVAELICQSYDIAADDRALRVNPSMFEELRGSYPVRREFSAYMVNGGSLERQNIAKNLGFMIFNEKNI